MGNNYILRTFEARDAAAFPDFAEVGVDPAFVPPHAFTLLHGEQPIACAGVIPMAVGVGRAWFILGEAQNGQTVGLVRCLRECLDDLLAAGYFHRIEATVALNHPERERFVEFLGFEREPLTLYSRSRRRQ